MPGVLIITTYPPRECGIATYSHDLFKSPHKSFSSTFSISVCALEEGFQRYEYPEEVKYFLDTNSGTQYSELSYNINHDDDIKLVLVQHEFGLFDHSGQDDLLEFLNQLRKPIILAFHTILPEPDSKLKIKVMDLVEVCIKIVVMTQSAAMILVNEYQVPMHKIEIVAHGTHLVSHLDKTFLKDKYGFQDKKILTTFGLLGPGKGLEITLDALPDIIQDHTDVMFLIIGKTHPGVVKADGEKYRLMLEAKVKALSLESHVLFINQYVQLSTLLEYLQMTDIYLFTSKDPNQAVSGTFLYAMSCACPIISTPIPQAKELLTSDTGLIIDFNDSGQLSAGVCMLLNNDGLRLSFSSNALHRIAPTIWENSAISHGNLFKELLNQRKYDEQDVVSRAKHSTSKNQDVKLKFIYPELKLDHIKRMTTEFGIIQFSKINQPDVSSGYTLDDNSRALIVYCMAFGLNFEQSDLYYINLYLDFIAYCQQADGWFLNYVDANRNFTDQNSETNLQDSNGRAIWALGYLISKQNILPKELTLKASLIFRKALPQISSIYSPRAMAFAIKGLYYAYLTNRLDHNSSIIKLLADRLQQMFLHEGEKSWLWFESSMTYANSVLPEALLLSWMDSGDEQYKVTAKLSFDFLLSKIFLTNMIKVVSNRSWMHKGEKADLYGEQPIDVAYTILALSRFYEVYQCENYMIKRNYAFELFLGNNHLRQIVYNPCTGGCYDGLEETHINLNQGAESTVSYLIARMTVSSMDLR
ncbi:MAG: glycosyltransferase [Saprospiraceae bacterium]|nr:glycosyltransferase [Saprospiraceae bacterium]